MRKADTDGAGGGRGVVSPAGTLEKLGGDPDGQVGELVASGRDGSWQRASPAERLAALDAAAGKYLEHERPAHTRRAYAADWRAWEDYTAELEIPLYAATIGTLVGFVRWLEVTRGYAPATVDRRLAGAVAGLKQAHVVVADEASQAAWEAVKRYKERAAATKQPRGRGAAPPLDPEQVRALIAACPDTRAGLRDRALLLIGFTIGARAVELSRLACHELVVDGNRGLVAEIPLTKTGLNSEHPVLPRNDTRPELCPVRAWKEWSEAAGITTGPALRPVDRWDHPHPVRGLSPQAVTAIVTAAGVRANLPFRITAHSLRHGMATSAREGGADQAAIARQGRWSPTSPVLYRYLRQRDRWSDNAANHLGL